MSNAVGLCSQMSSISWTWNACLRNINYKSWLNSANMGADQKGSESAIGIGIIVGWFWDEKIGYESKVVVGGVLLHWSVEMDESADQIFSKTLWEILKDT